jgi:hypothetical protein
MATAEKAEHELSKDEVRRLDAVTEHEVAQGHRVREVPDGVRAALKEEGIDPPAFVRLNRVNPARRRFIMEEVQKRYHRDLRDAEVMSNAQVLKVVTERGEWSDVMQRRMDELQRSTTMAMAGLWGEGLTPDTGAYAAEMLEFCDRYRQRVAESALAEEEKAALVGEFDKWVAYGPDSASDPRYEGYEPFTAQQRLFEALGTADAADLVNLVEETKDKQQRLIRLVEERVELMDLQLRHAKIFANTAESRRDHTEEMAQVYFTCERCDKAGLSKGRLTDAFDDLWNFPDRAIKWLLHESYFFHQNIPDGAREYLETFGFIAAEREERPANTANDQSAGSPAPQPSKLVGTPAEATPAASGASTPDRTSTTAS